VGRLEMLADGPDAKIRATQSTRPHISLARLTCNQSHPADGRRPVRPGPAQNRLITEMPGTRWWPRVGESAGSTRQKAD